MGLESELVPGFRLGPGLAARAGTWTGVGFWVRAGAETGARTGVCTGYRAWVGAGAATGSVAEVGLRLGLEPGFDYGVA